MAKEPVQRSRTAKVGPAVVLDGTYRVEREVRWLRPPSEVKLEPITGMLEEARVAAEAAAAEAAVEAGPTPEEIARQEAERILDEARQEAEDLKRQGREQGYADGLKEGVEEGRSQGREEGLRELRETLDRWLTMGDALTEAWRLRFEGLEEEMKDLSVSVAEKLVHAQLQVAPDTVLGLVKDALRYAAEAERVTVLVNPADVALVRGAKDDLAAVLKGTGRFEIVESENVEPGSCLVETKTQVIDATRKSRMEDVRDAMDGGRGGRKAG